MSSTGGTGVLLGKKCPPRWLKKVVESFFGDFKCAFGDSSVPSPNLNALQHFLSIEISRQHDWLFLILIWQKAAYVSIDKEKHDAYIYITYIKIEITIFEPRFNVDVDFHIV